MLGAAQLWGDLGSLSRLCRDEIVACILVMRSSQACEHALSDTDDVGAGWGMPGDTRDTAGWQVAVHIPWDKQKSITIAAAEQTGRWMLRRLSWAN